MGFRVDVLRNNGLGDCTNGGVTARYDVLTVVEFDGEAVKGYDDPCEERPAVRVVKRMLGGEPYYHVEPVEKRAGCVGPMMGGNYVVGMCHRLAELVGDRPLKVHDRFETPEQYEALNI